MTSRHNLLLLIDRRAHITKQINKLTDTQTQIQNAIDYIEQEIYWERFITFCQTPSLLYR